MEDKIMYINNVDKQNYAFNRLKYWLKSLNSVSLNQPIKIMKGPKLIRATNEITLGTSRIDSPLPVINCINLGRKLTVLGKC